MKTVLQVIYLASILLSALMALSQQKFLQKRKLGILTPFLWLTLIQELALSLFEVYSPVSTNTIVYHSYRILTIVVFSIVYYRVPFMKPVRRVILWLAALFLLLNVIVFSWMASIFMPNSYVALARGFVITCYALLFLFSYFNLDSPEEEKHWLPLLWITIGIVTFYPVISISITFQKYLIAYGDSFYGFRLYQLIPQVMSIFMYGCFCYAFYLCKKTK